VCGGGWTRQLAVKQEVAALTMEEVAPVAFSARDHTAPQEAFKGGSLAGKKAAGDVKGTTELSQVAERPVAPHGVECVHFPI
jgi:U3 small nucleolar ribonucleoprotein component